MFPLVARERSWSVRNAFFGFRRFGNSAHSTRKWDLFGAVCLERPAVVARKLNEIEARTATMLRECEFERSLKCEHELNVEKERRDKSSGVEDADDVRLQSFQDLEDTWIESAKNFQPAKMPESEIPFDKPLVLLAKTKWGPNSQWMLPTLKWNPGETLRQTAERALQACVRTRENSNWSVRFLGNAPAAFYKFKYPAPIAEKTDRLGGKIFFFKAEVDYQKLADLSPNSVVKDTPDSSSSIVESKWVAREGLQSFLDTRKYLNTVLVLVPPDE